MVLASVDEVKGDLRELSGGWPAGVEQAAPTVGAWTYRDRFDNGRWTLLGKLRGKLWGKLGRSWKSDRGRVGVRNFEFESGPA